MTHLRLLPPPPAKKSVAYLEKLYANAVKTFGYGSKAEREVGEHLTAARHRLVQEKISTADK